MPRTPKDVTDAELAVLQVLWDSPGATRRQITDALYPGGGPAHYTTVQKLLERLGAKGYVSRGRLGGVRTFTAAVGRDALISQRLRDVADKLCGGSLTPLLMNLVRAGSLSDGQLQQLRDLIKELTRKNEPR
jgi:predicted transcriptional regulator